MISVDELPKREGVELLDLAGMDSSWPVPVALWNAPRGFDTRGHPDQQPCHVIALRLSGGLVQRVDDEAGRRERLRPNGFSVHPAHQELRFVAPSAIRFAHLYVSDSFFRHISSAMSSSSEVDRIFRPDRVMYEDREITEAINLYVRRAFETKDRASKFEMENRANLIALRLLQRNWSEIREQAGGEMAPWQVRRICSHLEQNLDRAVSLEELSELVDLSVEHMCRAFRRATGVPPLRWHIGKRMEAARALLIETDASLTSIAQEVGYGGQSAFGAVFRAVVGLSPGRYRRVGRPPA